MIFNEEDDTLILLDDDEELEVLDSDQEKLTWNILVVDDDSEVHSVTELALKEVSVHHRRIALTHAHSGHEAFEILCQKNDFAVILLDVVMESDDAGLQLVKKIRDVLNNSDIRIILRTGQPGYAPELQVFQDYDINDYRTKSELSRTRLLTALIAAIRSYEQIQTISESRRGLEMIVHASSDILARRKMQHFAEGILTQIGALLGLKNGGIVCVEKGNPMDNDSQNWFVVGATGALSRYILQPFSELENPDIQNWVNLCKEKQTHLFLDQATLLYIRANERTAIIYLATSQSLKTIDRQLLEFFSSNISASFSNIHLVESLHNMAYIDPLTELSNRNGFIQKLDEIIDHEELVESTLKVVLLDISGFSVLNNDIGDESGDVLLVSFANRLKDKLKNFIKSPKDLARVGTDVFGIILSQDFDNKMLEHWATQPISVGDHMIPLSVKIGYVNINTHDQWGVNLFRKASIALYHAKESKNQIEMAYSLELESEQHSRLEIVRKLREAHEKRELKVWLQPQFKSDGITLSGAEALLRWPNPNGIGFAYNPGDFIPLAEHSGLIVDIGEWVLDESLDHLLHIRAQSGQLPRVAVNVSLMQFRQAGFAERVIQRLKDRGLQGSHLEIEITESVAMDEPQVVLSALKTLHEAGVRIAIDDFGTGYSSLAYLRELPHDCIKIDRAFIQEIIEGDENSGMLAQHIIELAQKLDKETVAEGVELNSQLKVLQNMGCTDIQGFLLARPMDILAFEQWLLLKK
jgi:diguanylate cyclase (GGDEF)-like protein